MLGGGRQCNALRGLSNTTRVEDQICTIGVILILKQKMETTILALGFRVTLSRGLHRGLLYYMGC